MKKIFILCLIASSFALNAQIKAITEPLYVLDGKIIPDIKSVNQNNIEAIQVLKGKEATAKYGDAGRNGVIVITSKSVATIPSRDTFDPHVTEVWDLKPKKIAPGTSSSAAPSDAIVLFDGTDLSKWSKLDGSDAKWEVKDGAMTVAKGTGDIKSKQTFGDFQLHIEWRTPTEIVGEGQGRGNSGIFLQERYELQVLDSYESVTYSNGQAGAIYKQSIPLVNACLKPGEWQTYDVIYTAPRFSDNGRVIVPAYITVLHNGVLVQNHTQIVGPTEYKGLPVYESHGKGSIKLQDHGNPVSFRNIWIRDL